MKKILLLLVLFLTATAFSQNVNDYEYVIVPTKFSFLKVNLTGSKLNIAVFGNNFLSQRINILNRLGSLIEQPSLYGHLTAKENLEIYGPFRHQSYHNKGKTISIEQRKAISNANRKRKGIKYKKNIYKY